jgi:pyruvate kinase
MLSGESAVGDYPVKAVGMMARIAVEVESAIEFKTYPPTGHAEIMALSDAVNHIEKIVDVKCILVLTTSGRSARYAAAGRPKAPIYALTNSLVVYHGINLIWGIKPILVTDSYITFEDIAVLTDRILISRNIAKSGDKILVLGGIPANHPGGTNFIKIHTVS